MLHYFVVRSSFSLIGAVCLCVWAEGDAGVPRRGWRGTYDLLGKAGRYKKVSSIKASSTNTAGQPTLWLFYWQAFVQD